eukprot:242773_1
MASYLTLLLVLIHQPLHVICYLPNEEYHALSMFYDSFGGAYWTNCKWNLTLLDQNIINDSFCGLTIEFISISSSEQTVTEINFGFPNNLSGTIHESIGNLRNLTTFYIDYNDYIYGTIPHTMCLLKKLNTVRIRYGDLDGVIPLCLSNITTIEVYSFLYNFRLKASTEHLQLLCENNNSKNISRIDLYYINFIGSLPDCIGYDFSNLLVLQLGSSNIVGTLPTSIGLLTELRSIGLVGTQLSGIVPLELSKIKTLEWYLFQSNPNLHLSSPHIELLCNYTNHSMFITLALSDVMFNGSLPNCVNQFKNLQYLYLYELPNLYGTFPQFIGEFKHLFDLGIYDTSLTGVIELESLCDLTNLFGIQIELHDQTHQENDSFTVAIPECIGNLNVYDLGLYGNRIGSTIPTQMCELSQLETFQLSDTSISGSIPNCFTNLQNLVVLTIANNPKLNGELPVINSSFLFMIQIFDNPHLGGKIFNKLHVSYSNIAVLLLHNNAFYDGGFEPFMSKILTESSNSLQALTLYDNSRIYGTFPVTNSNTKIYMKNLQIFAIQNCDIKGYISDNIFIGESVSQYIDPVNGEINPVISILLHGNIFSGNLPKNLVNSNSTNDNYALLGNLFLLTNADSVAWLSNSPFIQNNNLYLTTFDMNISWFFIIFLILMVIFFAIITMKKQSVIKKLKR